MTEKNVVGGSQADAPGLAKAMLAPNRTIVATHHETEDRPGSSGRNRDLVLAPRARLGHQPVGKRVGVYSRL
jgi:hypothetical protein